MPNIKIPLYSSYIYYISVMYAKWIDIMRKGMSIFKIQWLPFLKLANNIATNIWPLIFF